jgi:hypothetical protein
MMQAQKTILGTGTYPPACAWGYLFGYDNPVVGVAPAPTGSALTLPPASGEEAQALVDAQLAAQLEAQKKANAAGVTSGWIDSAASGVVDTSASIGDSISNTLQNPFGVSWLVWGAIGIGVFALVVGGGGSARRVGR